MENCYKKENKELVGGGKDLNFRHVLISFSTILLIIFITPNFTSAETIDAEGNDDVESTLQSIDIANTSEVLNTVIDDSNEDRSNVTEDEKEDVTEESEQNNSIDLETENTVNETDNNETDTNETGVNESKIDEQDDFTDRKDEETEKQENELKPALQSLNDTKDESEESENSSNHFKLRDRDDKIIEIKHQLMKVGFGTHWKNPTNYFGTDTEKVVREFQEYYQITPSGEMDAEFFSKLEEVLSSHYQKGNRSEDILQFKRNLMRVGFGLHWNNPTNYYGPDTEKVVREFQESNKLAINGIGDIITLQTLEKLLQEIEQNGFSKGMRSIDIQRLKLDLVKLGFGTHWNNPTTYFGADTEKVVRKFQRYYSIQATGALDKATQGKIKEILSSPFQKGNRSEEIQKLKYDLMKVGFGTHWKNPTTYFGANTENVVREFQEANRLAVNGILDQVTLSRLKDMLENGFRRGMGSPFIQDIKKDLMKAGFGTHWKNPTTYYGADTEKVVREFQKYYSLTVDGAMNDETLEKLEEVLNGPYRKGKRSNKIQELKIDLMKVGFGLHWNNPTNYYGSDTEKVVREFQRAYKLAVNGILDEVSLKKLDDLLAQGLTPGTRSEEVRQIKYDLMKAGFGTHWKNPTTFYGSDTKKVVKQFQAYYSLYVDGELHLATLNKLNEVLNSPYQFGKRSSEIQKLKEDLMKIGFGTHWKNPTTYYGRDTEKVVKEFQKAYGLVVNGILDEVSLKVLKSEAAKVKLITIVIDAGHGGRDPGAEGNGLQEKDINLDIAKKVQKLLEEAGYKVIMTRTTDTFLELKERSSLANNSNADLFVSIHTNAGGGQGIETYWYSKGPEAQKSKILAEYIQNGMIKETKAINRGVKRYELTRK